MKFLVVSSPHAFATRDVFTGITSGMRKAAGEENVRTYDVIKRYRLFHSWTQMVKDAYGEVPRGVRANVLACEPVLGSSVHYDIDVVIITSPMYFPMSVVELIHKVGKQVWAIFTECPYEDEFWARTQAPYFDKVFVNDRNSVARFSLFNPETYYLPHSYDPDKHFPRIGDRKNNHEHVIFIGTDFQSRRELFRLANWDGIDFRLYGNWQEVHEEDKLFRYVRHRLIDNHTSAQMYRGAVIGVSAHRQERYWDRDGILDDGEAYSVGPRTLELAACGLYQTSDGNRQELFDIFGESISTFDSPESLEREVRWALEHPVERQELAQQQLEAVQGHTFENRAGLMLATV